MHNLSLHCAPLRPTCLRSVVSADLLLGHADFSDLDDWRILHLLRNNGPGQLQVRSWAEIHAIAMLHTGIS